MSKIIFSFLSFFVAALAFVGCQSNSVSPVTDRDGNIIVTCHDGSMFLLDRDGEILTMTVRLTVISI